MASAEPLVPKPDGTIDFKDLPLWPDCPFGVPKDVEIRRGPVRHGLEVVDFFVLRDPISEAMAAMALNTWDLAEPEAFNQGALKTMLLALARARKQVLKEQTFN